MRVNVYGEEITDRLEIVEAIADSTGSKFIGIRFYLESSDKMYPPKHEDDDSSGVTFWCKSSKGGYKSEDGQRLAALMMKAGEMLLRKM